MTSKLIIIRGNSASGKTTIAKALQKELGYGTMLISQDVFRREILRTKDGTDNPSIQLIYDTAMYGHKIGYDVIIEGILAKKHYGKMLYELTHEFEDLIFAYYLDIPFEETLERHRSKANASEYGEVEMKEWWNDKDYLGVKDEKYLDETYDEKHILNTILKDVRKL